MNEKLTKPNFPLLLGVLLLIVVGAVAAVIVVSARFKTIVKGKEADLKGKDFEIQQIQARLAQSKANNELLLELNQDRPSPTVPVAPKLPDTPVDGIPIVPILPYPDFTESTSPFVGPRDMLFSQQDQPGESEPSDTENQSSDQPHTQEETNSN